MFDKTFVSFPGLGIEEMELNKIVFTLFGKLEVRWYGLIITLGIICAVAKNNFYIPQSFVFKNSFCII